MYSSPSQRAQLAELAREYRRLLELARRAPRIHALIDEADCILDRLPHIDKRRLDLEVWLIYLHGIKDAGREITEESLVHHRRELAEVFPDIARTNLPRSAA